jgi:hypothetical protein
MGKRFSLAGVVVLSKSYFYVLTEGKKISLNDHTALAHVQYREKLPLFVNRSFQKLFYPVPSVRRVFLNFLNILS